MLRGCVIQSDTPSLDVKILNMFNFRILAVDVADNANDVEAIIGDVPIMEIVLHGVARAGTATVFPQAIGLAAMFDEDMQEEIATVISREARAKYNGQSSHGDRDIYKGLTVWSPNINIFRDPRWGRILPYIPARRRSGIPSTRSQTRRT